MNTEDTQRLLRELAPREAGTESTIGRTGDIATLRMTSINNDERSVLIESPGDWWISVSTEAGFARVHADQGLEAQETQDILATYIQIGLAYLRQGGEVQRTRWLRLPNLVVNLRGENVTLERPVATNVASLLTNRRR